MRGHGTPETTRSDLHIPAGEELPGQRGTEPPSWRDDAEVGTFDRFLQRLLRRVGIGARGGGLAAPGHRRDGVVSWLPGAVPGTPVETLVAERLHGRAPVQLPVLVDWLAERLLARSRCENPGSWVVDIGLWGTCLFRREAAEAITELEGRLLSIQEAPGDADRPARSGPQAPAKERG